MHSLDQLCQLLHRIDGKGYKAYKDLKGSYDFPHFVLSIDHVQGDPFSSPSRVSIQIPSARAGFPSQLFSNPIRKIALIDFLARQWDQAIQKITRGHRGTGKSGLFFIESGQQEVLERNCIEITAEMVEARFLMGLPADGRRILGRQAEEMFCDELIAIADQALLYENLSADSVQHHIDAVEDQEALREQLQQQGLVAFVGNGSTLPRRSGIDDSPLREGDAGPVIPFSSPPELEIELSQPNRGSVRGMGIPEGVTLIVGGGFHGKSTLLQALERGVYNHIPGDGREWTVTIHSGVKIRAEDGRHVEKVDISPFITNLPYGKDTLSFSTEKASGSTSQAAYIMEALEVGSKLLLIDEDTSATNFIIRDARMQALVSKEKEPITPFVDKVRQLLDDHHVSTILVMGGSGDYLESADHVIMMDQYRPVVVTDRARQVIETFPTTRKPEGGPTFGTLPQRCPLAESFDARRGRRPRKIDTQGLKAILFGTTEVDLTALEQLVDIAQTRAIGAAMFYYAERCPQDLPLKDNLEKLMTDLNQGGLDILSPYKTGNLARPRIFEVAFAINRMRSLKVQ
ncbi:MAG: ABC-ATPase domain-containing protein [Acidobacteriota bacterium]